MSIHIDLSKDPLNSHTQYCVHSQSSRLLIPPPLPRRLVGHFDHQDGLWERMSMCDLCPGLVATGVGAVHCLTCNVVVHAACAQRAPPGGAQDVPSGGMFLKGDVGSCPPGSRRRRLRRGTRALRGPAEQDSSWEDKEGGLEIKNRKPLDMAEDGVSWDWVCCHCMEERATQKCEQGEHVKGGGWGMGDGRCYRKRISRIDLKRPQKFRKILYEE